MIWTLSSPLCAINKMDELLSDNLWPTIKRLAKRSSSKRAAVAYVTSEEYVEFGEGDVLVTDASHEAIASGQTNAKLLERAFERGAKLYSLDGLHAKVLHLGGTAVIGSANLSETSARPSTVEAAWVSDSPTAVGMATSLINQLTVQARAIDASFLERILKIKVIAHPRAKGKRRKPAPVKVRKPRTWTVGVHELIKDYPAEQMAIEAGTAIAEDKVTKSTCRGSDVRVRHGSGARPKKGTR